MIETTQASERLPAALKSTIFHFAYILDLLLWRPSNEILIQESYWLRVYAHDIFKHRLFGMLVFSCIGRLLPKPDVAIFLECPADQRKLRYLASKEWNARDDSRFFERPNEMARINKLLADLARKQEYHFINSNQYEAEQTASIILKISEAFLRGNYDDLEMDA